MDHLCLKTQTISLYIACTSQLMTCKCGHMMKFIKLKSCLGTLKQQFGYSLSFVIVVIGEITKITITPSILVKST